MACSRQHKFERMCIGMADMTLGEIHRNGKARGRSNGGMGCRLRGARPAVKAPAGRLAGAGLSRLNQLFLVHSHHRTGMAGGGRLP